GLLDSFDINKVSRKDLLKVDKLINSRISVAQDENEKMQLFIAKKNAANAIRLNHMDELIETQGIQAVSDYIEKNFEKIKRNTANKSLKELFTDKDFRNIIRLTNAIQSKGLVHPKLEKLKELLHSQIIQNNQSRILVFCHYRDSVNNIVNFLEDDEVIRVHRFVGQQSKGSDKGLTQKQQIKLLDDFREGIYNTLVGTSVAEEGLDVAECDLVIFYDVVPSAIRSIQRRGRTGRNKEGKVYILMAEGTRDEAYFWVEKNKERQMKLSLKKMKNALEDSTGAQSSILNFVEQENEKKAEKNNIIEINDNQIKIVENADKIKIFCDTRETSSPVVRILSLMGVKLKLVQLEVGDYVISERVGIERKSAQDFNDSIKDGRLFDELFNLTRNFERSILILEGDPFSNTNVNENALYGAITSIILNLGITIYKTNDAKETATFLLQLAKKEYSESKGETKLRFEKKPIETSRLLEYIIAGIPGVNALRAKNLLKNLKTLNEIFNADISDLMQVENIGKKIAQEIYKISRYKYQDD
ncbi:MAG: ERCC4 domain-containing protein, partial [Promethearchaeota archaeon]